MSTIQAPGTVELVDRAALPPTPSVPPQPPEDRPGPLRPAIPIGRLSRLYDRIDSFVSRLSVRDHFWQRICSLIWLPYAFFSGIRMKGIDARSCAILPYRRFNRNWYRAMAGGALLANSEIAGGMYVFGICGGDYTVVCKQLSYTFLRPCFGTALYKMTPREDIAAMLKARGEFNVTLDLEISQRISSAGDRDKRVGRCEATFHVAPKIQRRIKQARGKK
jgi:hypothetical protein